VSSARNEVEVALRPARPLLQLRRQRGQDLEPRIREHPAEPELRGRRRSDEQRLRLRRREPRQLGPIAAGKPVPACRPSNGLHGDARGRQRLDVAVHGSDGDLEVRGELLRRELPAHLEQEEQGNEPSRPHRA
jgi:hypothetical protein